MHFSTQIPNSLHTIASSSRIPSLVETFKGCGIQVADQIQDLSSDWNVGLQIQTGQSEA